MKEFRMEPHRNSFLHGKKDKMRDAKADREAENPPPFLFVFSL